MKMNEELWIDLGFIKKERKMGYIWQHNYFKNLTFKPEEYVNAELKDVSEIIQKYISKESFNNGRTYVQNQTLKALGLNHILNNIKKEME